MGVNILTEPKFKRGGSGDVARKFFATGRDGLGRNQAEFRKNFMWLAANRERLRVKYGGNYVAVYDRRICKAAKDPRELISYVRKAYGDNQAVVVNFIGKEKIRFLL